LSRWPSAKSTVVFRALLRKGWRVVSQKGSHIKLQHPGFGSFMFGFHEGEEIGPKMLSRIAKRTGLTADDL
jgi:predicted RNA binding protein YcfA (HicA-like mRNA interferase family)